MPRLSTPTIAILWFILTGFLGVTINMVAKQLSGELHAFQIVFFYNLMALPFFLVSTMVFRKRLHLRTRRWKLYSLRAVLEFSGFSLLFLAVSKLPLPAHTALGFTAPLFATIAAIFLLGERSHKAQWFGLAAGAIGVLLITRPGADGAGMQDAGSLPYQAWYVIAAALCFALCGICIKKLTHTEPVSTIAFYMLLLTAIVSLPFALSVWQWPSPTSWLWIALLGALVFAVQNTVGQAILRADISLLQPFTFLHLLWSSLYGYILFDEAITGWTLLGAAVILSSVLITLAHTRRTAQRATKLAAMGN